MNNLFGIDSLNLVLFIQTNISHPYKLDDNRTKGYDAKKMGLGGRLYRVLEDEQPPVIFM